MHFSELLDAVDELPREEQAELIEIVRRRLVEQRREELAGEIREARREYDAGGLTPKTPDEIVRDILS